MNQPEKHGDGAEFAHDQSRIVITIATGVIGSLLFLTGAAFAVWSYVLHGFAISDWRFWVGYGGQFAALAAFVALLQWNRDLDRVSPAIRRTLYGYNIFLVTVFLAAVLVLVNILVVQYGNLIGLKPSYDWTSQGVFTLQDVSVQQIKSLTKPVQVLALYPRGTRQSMQLEQLFQLYAGANKDFSFEFVDLLEDKIRTEDILKKYPDAIIRGGGGFLEPSIIITFGTGDDAPHKVVKDSDIFKMDTKEIDMMTGQRGGDRSFFGENAVTSAVRALMEDKKTSVYFVTGHGEKDPNNTDERDPDGIGLLKERLTSLNIKAEALNLLKSEAPADANLLVVAGPKSAFEAVEIQKIRDFMDRKDSNNERAGRLLVMFDTSREMTRGAAADAGLGELLASYQVQVKDNIVYDFESAYQRADQLIVMMDTAVPVHPIVAPLKGRWVLMARAREITPLADPHAGITGQPPPPSRYQTMKLFATSPAPKAWAQADQEARPSLDGAGNTPGPVSLGVAVSEGGSPPPASPFAPPPPSSKSTPVAVVLGDATFTSNYLVAQKPEHEDLFLNAVNWLGGRTADIGIQPRVKKYSRLDLDNAGYYTMIFEPFFHMVAIAGFLAGLVWMVRAERYQMLWLPVGATLLWVGLWLVLVRWLFGITGDECRTSVMRLLLTCIVMWSIGVALWAIRTRAAQIEAARS